MSFCVLYLQRYNFKNVMSNILGLIPQLFLFLKAYFQNILACDGIREGVWMSFVLRRFGEHLFFDILQTIFFLQKKSSAKKML